MERGPQAGGDVGGRPPALCAPLEGGRGAQRGLPASGGTRGRGGGGERVSRERRRHGAGVAGVAVPLPRRSRAARRAGAGARVRRSPRRALERREAAAVESGSSPDATGVSPAKLVFWALVCLGAPPNATNMGLSFAVEQTVSSPECEASVGKYRHGTRTVTIFLVAARPCCRPPPQERALFATERIRALYFCTPL